MRGPTYTSMINSLRIQISATQKLEEPLTSIYTAQGLHDYHTNSLEYSGAKAMEHPSTGNEESNISDAPVFSQVCALHVK